MTSAYRVMQLEADGKVLEGKEELSISRSKGSLGCLNIITGKSNEASKTSGAAANRKYSKSCNILAVYLCFGISCLVVKAQVKDKGRKEVMQILKCKYCVECDELAQRAEASKEGNASLTAVGRDIGEIGWGGEANGILIVLATVDCVFV
ncbi:hypothetical protein POM88_034355 [Heracleum sosnowskyi]|uniref:Uncharacterized protein n=1 Tax=Heracleum sosnowskyi TaxID=360622 RepID=A0AAD8HL35_9APIA|nr:hypothetical protein POM88_034355 [Heracleum sosnowskyi]